MKFKITFGEHIPDHVITRISVDTKLPESFIKEALTYNIMTVDQARKLLQLPASSVRVHKKLNKVRLFGGKLFVVVDDVFHRLLLNNIEYLLLKKKK